MPACFPFTKVEFPEPTIECDHCKAEMATIESAIDAGWIPSYYDGEEEVSAAACPACQKRLNIRFNKETGDYEIVRPKPVLTIAELMPHLRPSTLAAIFVDVCGPAGGTPDELQHAADVCWTQGIALVGEKEFDNLVGKATP